MEDIIQKPIEVKTPTKIIKAKKKKKIRKKRKIKPMIITPQKEIEKPTVESPKPKTGLEAILEENVIYPNITLNLDEIQKTSKNLGKRVK